MDTVEEALHRIIVIIAKVVGTDDGDESSKNRHGRNRRR